MGSKTLKNKHSIGKSLKIIKELPKSHLVIVFLIQLSVILSICILGVLV